VLTKIHHVGVAVRQAEQALSFYRDQLGLPVTKDAVLEQQGIRGVLLSAGETEIELLEPLRPDTPVGRFIDSYGEGLHHLCFATDDIDAELEGARAKGLPLIDQQARQGLAGMIAFLHPRATRGILVEYAQPPEEAEDAAHVTAGSTETRFDHLAVAVSDLDAGVHAFSANFGLQASLHHESPALGIRAAGLPIGDAYIGVVTPLASQAPVARFLNKHGEGLYLISLAVTGLDIAASALRDAGQTVTEPAFTEQGSRLAFVSPRGTNGVLIQLIERAPA
jgi:methylmalonyl-CoA/ethylmalonyl-CoA epimerase